MCVCLSVTLTLYYSLPRNTVSEINQMKKRIYYCHHWRRLDANFWGTGRRISAENFFIRSPEKCEIWGTAGTHCYLELNVGSVLSCIDAVYITIFTL